MTDVILQHLSLRQTGTRRRFNVSFSLVLVFGLRDQKSRSLFVFIV